MTLQVSTVGVIGLGTMGAGIAEVFARDGYRVVAVETDEAGSPAAGPGSRPRPPAPSTAAS